MNRETKELLERWDAGDTEVDGEDIVSSLRVELTRANTERDEARVLVDRFHGKLMVLRSHIDTTIQSMEKEVDAGILDPDWCKGHIVTLNELKSVLDFDVKATRCHAAVCGRGGYALVDDANEVVKFEGDVLLVKDVK